MKRIAASLASFMLILFVAGIAFAQGDAEVASQSGLIAIGAALAVSLAAVGSASAQGRMAAAALEGIARNPQSSDKVFTPLVLSLAFPETLTIFAFIIAIMMQGKI